MRRIAIVVLAAVAANPTAEYNESHGGGFMSPENYTRLVYQSLTR